MNKSPLSKIADKHYPISFIIQWHCAFRGSSPEIYSDMLMKLYHNGCLLNTELQQRGVRATPSTSKYFTQFLHFIAQEAGDGSLLASCNFFGNILLCSSWLAFPQAMQADLEITMVSPEEVIGQITTSYIINARWFFTVPYKNSSGRWRMTLVCSVRYHRTPMVAWIDVTYTFLLYFISVLSGKLKQKKF